MADQWDETTEPGDEPTSVDKKRPCLLVLRGYKTGEAYFVKSDEVLIGRSEEAQVHVLDDAVSRAHCRIRRSGPYFVLEDLHSRNGTFCNARRVETRVLQVDDKIQIGRTVLKFTFQDDLDESFQKRMYQSALQDDLTGAYNKHYFSQRLEAELSSSQRHHVPLTLLLLDLDHFKRVNDEHGHLAGDALLTGFATEARTILRTDDVFARFGGDEFAVISRGTRLPGARRLAERLRRITEATPIEYEGRPVPCTVSIGIASYPDLPVQRAAELLVAADRALYKAKQNGRNCVMACEDEFYDEHTRETGDFPLVTPPPYVTQRRS